MYSPAYVLNRDVDIMSDIQTSSEEEDETTADFSNKFDGAVKTYIHNTGVESEESDSQR